MEKKNEVIFYLGNSMCLDLGKGPSIYLLQTLYLLITLLIPVFAFQYILNFSLVPHGIPSFVIGIQTGTKLDPVQLQYSLL